MEAMERVMLQLLLYSALGILLAFASAWAAAKFGGRRWLWVLMSLVPGLNVGVFYFLPIRIIGATLDRLAAIEAKISERSEF